MSIGTGWNKQPVPKKDGRTLSLDILSPWPSAHLSYLLHSRSPPLVIISSLLSKQLAQRKIYGAGAGRGAREPAAGANAAGLQGWPGAGRGGQARAQVPGGRFEG